MILRLQSLSLTPLELYSNASPEMNATGPLQDIIKRFPYEIWSKCILNAIYRSPEGPLPFLSVAPHWETLLLDSPEMWTYIQIDEGEDVVARAHTFLHLSQQHPLELAIAFFGSSWTSSAPILLPHKGRIHSIYMLEQSFFYLGAERILYPSGDINFPSFRTIATNRFDASGSSFGPLFTLCPNLQYSESTVFVGEDDLKWIQPSLRTIRVAIRLETLATLVARAKPCLELSDLERLDIYLVNQNVKAGTTPEQYQPEDFVLSSKTVRHLRLSTNVQTILRGILSSSFRDLSSLIVIIFPRYLDIVINSLRLLPLLQDLSLDIAYHKDHTGCPQLRPSDISKLRTLRIDIFNDLWVPFVVIFTIFTENDALIGVENFDLTSKKGPIDFIPLITLIRVVYSLRNAIRITLPTISFFGSRHQY